ncbi:MAG: tetratricopeptide repeat protein, partial [Alistipes sp.]|nr:tetratricopeptide repeat protein [Alistipes sp.]
HRYLHLPLRMLRLMCIRDSIGSVRVKHYAAYKRAVTFGLQGLTDQKLKALRQIADARDGEYADAASCELGRSCIALGRYAEGARQLEKFLADYPSSPHRVQACSDLGLAYFNLGDQKKSMHYYDMVVKAAPHSPEAREAMQGIREIYVSDGDIDGYFKYAAQEGLESDVTSISRDSLSFAAAQKLYLTNRHEVAARSLRSYIRSYPKGSYRADALYYLSDCYLRLGQRKEAIGTLSELADLGTNKYSVTVLERLSEMTWADRQYDKAAAAYRKFYDVAPTAADRQKAMTGYVRATVAGGDPQKIADMAADVCARSDAGAVALREARFAWAEQLRASKQQD